MRARRLLGILLVALPVLVAGCAEEVDVKSYDVDYPDREQIRLLTAIVPDGETTWVFKLQGPDAAVAAQKKAFDDLIASVRLDEKKEQPISWTKPDGWEEEKGGGEFRIATFRIKAGARSMEVAVTKLPQLTAPGEKGGNSVLDNVNRWRRQMALPSIEAADLEKNIRREKVDGREVILADLSALGTFRVPVRNPHGGGMPPIGAGKLGKADVGKLNLPFMFEVPQGWVQRAKGGQFSSLAYDVVAGKERAAVTLTSLNGDGGGILTNLKRWRHDKGQAELPPIPDGEILRQAQDLTVAGVKATYVDYGGSSVRILGIILPLEGSTWFVKMTGSPNLVGREKANFEAFVKSFKLAQ